MKITFWGAAQQVTGSMHLLELESGTNVLIDCGLDYENRKEFETQNATFPFAASDIDILILTHAHIDHSGNVPNLIKQGFAGHIICSAPTLELSEYLLQDSLNIQLQDIRKRRKQFYRNKKKNKVKGPIPQALYTKRHIEDMLDMAVVLNPGQTWSFGDDLSITLSPAGHILGAMSATLKVTEDGEVKTLGFTGDLGNYNSKLVPDPLPMEGLDFLVSESTYGGRKHFTDSRKAEIGRAHV